MEFSRKEKKMVSQGIIFFKSNSLECVLTDKALIVYLAVGQLFSVLFG